MKFISLKGTEIQWKARPRVAKRTLSFSFTNSGTWTEDKFLNIIWKHAGLLCESVRLVSVYRYNNSVGHAYELTFQTGPGFSLNSRRDVNNLVADIEADILTNLPVVLRGYTHRPKSLATDHELTTLGQESDRSLCI